MEKKQRKKEEKKAEKKRKQEAEKRGKREERVLIIQSSEDEEDEGDGSDSEVTILSLHFLPLSTRNSPLSTVPLYSTNNPPLSHDHRSMHRWC
jgi:hypothetical protein